MLFYFIFSLEIFSRILSEESNGAIYVIFQIIWAYFLWRLVWGLVYLSLEFDFLFDKMREEGNECFEFVIYKNKYINFYGLIFFLENFLAFFLRNQTEIICGSDRMSRWICFIYSWIWFESLNEMSNLCVWFLELVRSN